MLGGVLNGRGLEEDVVQGRRRNCSMFKCYGNEPVERKKGVAGDRGELLIMGFDAGVEELSLVIRMSCLFIVTAGESWVEVVGALLAVSIFSMNWMTFLQLKVSMS